jgi:hypothetical protein
LQLPLPLQVSAVILSAAKDPEGLDLPSTSALSTRISIVVAFSNSIQRNIYPTEGRTFVCRKKRPRRKTLPLCQSPRAKRLISLPLPLLLFFICHFQPKKRMSSPKTT